MNDSDLKRQTQPYSNYRPPERPPEWIWKTTPGSDDQRIRELFQAGQINATRYLTPDESHAVYSARRIAVLIELNAPPEVLAAELRNLTRLTRHAETTEGPREQERPG